MTHSSRIFETGNATTLHVTIAARVVADPQIPFKADGEGTVTTDGDRLIVTESDEEIDG